MLPIIDYHSPHLIREYLAKIERPVKKKSYIIIPNILSASQLEFVLAERNEKLHHTNVDEYRQSILGRFSAKTNSAFVDVYPGAHSRIECSLMEANRKWFNFDIDSMCRPMYHEYGPSCRNDWHQDTPLGLDHVIPDYISHRKLSATIALTDDYIGGDFQIQGLDNPYSLFSNIKLRAGDAIMFPSHLQHRVTPIGEGIRKVLIYWLCGPRLK